MPRRGVVERSTLRLNARVQIPGSDSRQVDNFQDPGVEEFVSQSVLERCSVTAIVETAGLRTVCGQYWLLVPEKALDG